ncbi:MAG TPA: phage baseplate assembly protein V [Chitinophagales bacterium]|nr:phage baseplate assembly protein V [Chitinophagales bacterium]
MTASQDSTVKIEFENGDSVKIVSQLVVNQSIDQHHSFEIRVPAEVLEGKDEPMFESTKDNIGKIVKIQIADTYFKGIISQVSVSKYGNSQGDIVIRGYSPTYVLDDQPNCVSFENKNLQQIINQVAANYPKNFVDIQCDPKNKSSIPYLVQYKENSFQFFRRLAVTYGEWFFYDGNKIYFGKPAAGKEIPLYFGKDLFNFDVSMRIGNPNFSMKSYDYEKNEVVESSSSDASISNLDKYGSLALSASENLSSFKPGIVTHQGLLDKSKLDGMVKVTKGMIASQYVIFNGVSNNSSLKIGSVIEVTGKMGSQNDNIDNFGKYIVIGITHTASGIGNYQNHFKAIPHSLEFPPQFSPVHETHCETQTAVVKENNDPKGLGRIRVQFVWQKPPAMSPWIRAVSPHGGKGRGFYFVPEKGDEVIVGFENGDADFPFVVGSSFHGKAKSDGMEHSSNYIKGIRTVSGNSIVIIDESGKEEIKIFNKDEKNILSLTCEGDGKVTIKTKGDISFSAEKSITIEAKEKINFKSGKETEMQAQSMKISADNKYELSSQEIKAKSTKHTIEADASISIKSSATLEVKSSATMDLDGGGIASLKAGLVKIN